MKLSALGTGARLAHARSPRIYRRLPNAIDCSRRLTGDSENAPNRTALAGPRYGTPIRLERPFSVSGLRLRYDISWTDRLRYTSDTDDRNFAARGPHEPFYVVRIACENGSFLPNGCSHNNGVNDIRRFGHA